jgi:hypothetical protein
MTPTNPPITQLLLDRIEELRKEDNEYNTHQFITVQRRYELESILPQIQKIEEENTTNQ